MLFNSLIFLVFITAFFCLKPLFDKTPLNIRLSFLLAASFFFYGWWNPYYIFLLIGTGLIDFIAALCIVRWGKIKSWILFVSLGTNLGVLFYFKYLLFFTEIIGAVFNWDVTQLKIEQIVLPIGISFYTFQSMSYTIDVYRQRMQPVNNPLLFFSFISFFPHLVAGPIVRAREILPQLARVKSVNEFEIFNGVKLIVIGYFKKTVMADNLAPFVYEAFSANTIVQGFNYWWLVALSFTFQIYFDFSGYSDIARGLAKCMGIHFRMNFNHPYGALSFKQFWARWHISLSTWFRDYVYVALGGNKKGVFRGHLNMWITMLVSGLWHGANFTFIIWGALHALYLSVERGFNLTAVFSKTNVAKILYSIIVFTAVIIGWVFFRAESVTQASAVLGQMFNFFTITSISKTNAYYDAVLFLIIAIVVEVAWVSGIRLKKYFSATMYKQLEMIYLAILIACAVFFRGPGEQFIYFQF